MRKRIVRKANLSRTYLTAAKAIEADFRQAILEEAVLIETNLFEADLSGAILNQACLQDAICRRARFKNAILTNVDLLRADLSDADLREVDLSDVDLREASLVRANLENANLTGIHVHGISAWNVRLDRAIQSNLVITDRDEPTITVDNLEVAQFIYLLLNNQKIRDVINTITSKVVLILGRFTNERKPVLDALRGELRNHNFSPVVFDFDPSAKRDLTETISLLANMSRFVIADITDAKSIPQELHTIIHDLPSVIVQPILHGDATEYAMFEHYERYPWVLPIYRYQDIPNLLASIKEHVIKSIEEKEYEKDKMKVLEEENRKLREKVKELEKGK